MEIVFATGNAHKVREVNEIAGSGLRFKSLADIGCTEEIPETADTLRGNAIQKANYVSRHYGVNCFAEDTGLEVAALDGAPGVHTARFAGPEKDPAANIALLLRKLQGVADRRANFRTVIALNLDGTQHIFEGICEGTIAHQPAGDGGFGYDPIFIPDGMDGKTFAQLSKEEKNKISHRGKAVRQLFRFLENRTKR